MSGLEFVPAAKNGNEPGLCECGCGGKTAIAKNTNEQTGAVAGQPLRYLPGHNMRVEHHGAVGGKPKSASSETVEPLRARLRSVLGDVPEIDTLVAIIKDACKPVRKVRVFGQCPKCSCNHARYAQLEDAKVARETLAFVLDQTEGRPGVAGVDDAGVVVKLVYVGVDE